MNDELTCDRFLDELESAVRRLRTSDGKSLELYSTWKQLGKTMKDVRTFIAGTQNRANAKRKLMRAPRINPVELAQMIGVIRMLPELARHGTEDIGDSLSSGPVSKFSHEEKNAIRDGFRALTDRDKSETAMSPTEAVKALAVRKGISIGKVWEILSEDTTLPEYWEQECRRRIRAVTKAEH